MDVLHTETKMGDSREQRIAERHMVEAFSQRVGCKLNKQRLDLPEGGWIEIDACNEDQSVLCEAWARQGPPKSAQKRKVMTDAVKLVLAGRVLGKPSRKVLLFGDSAAAAWFRRESTTWMAQALRSMDVDVEIVELPEEVRRSVRAAQVRQEAGNRHVVDETTD